MKPPWKDSSLRRRRTEMLWEVDIYPAPGQPDLLGRPIFTAAVEFGLSTDLKVAAARSYLIQAKWNRGQAEQVALELLTDTVVERVIVAQVGDTELSRFPLQATGFNGAGAQLIHVLPKPGVMDAVSQSVMSAIEDFGLKAEAVRTLRKYWIEGLDSDRVGMLSGKVLAND